MSIPLFYPPARYVAKLNLAHAITLRDLCELAGVPCRASGDWVTRRVEIVLGGDLPLSIEAEPGYKGAVRIRVPGGDAVLGQPAYRIALGALAYGLMDGVARESIRGAPWAKPAVPRGRPRTGVAQAPAERQRRYRERQRDRSAG